MASYHGPPSIPFVIFAIILSVGGSLFRSWASSFNGDVAIGVKLKFEDFQVTTLEKSAVEFSHENFQQLLGQIWVRRQGRSIRLIGLHVTLPEEKVSEQMSLW